MKLSWKIALPLAVIAVTLPSPARTRRTKTGCLPGDYSFKAAVRAGQTFSRRFNGFVFALRPSRYGWYIDIAKAGQHYLANMTGPSHGPGNPLYIEGWHFRNAANTDSNTGDVNEPQEERKFVFSPRWPKCENARGLEKDGQGILQITDMELGNLKPGEKATIVKMEFAVKLTVGASACAPCPAE